MTNRARRRRPPQIVMAVTIGVVFCAAGFPAAALPLDHPVLTEVYQDPPGLDDGPVGRDPTNLDQSFIEIYLPPAADLNPGLAKDALRLAFYEIEGDTSSSGYELVNYRIDLPTFDLDPSNGLTPGAIARPSSGVVVIGWVDYVGDPPTGLAGTPASRIALIDGGVTSTPGVTFIAMNGAQFTGTTNFAVPPALSLIHMPAEATSGIIQNGSGVYLLVNRDAAGYVELYDDKDTAHVPPLANADPSLDTGTVLTVGALLDAFATSDDLDFDPLQIPNPDPLIDLGTVLPPGGAFSLLVTQLAVAPGNHRPFLDVVSKTTEDLTPDDPVVDAGVYLPLSLTHPVGRPSPGRVHFSTDPAELSVGDAAVQLFGVLAGTTGRPGILTANVGGDALLTAEASPGASSDPGVMTIAAGDADSVSTGMTELHPGVEITVDEGAVDGATATSAVTVTATNPGVVNPVQGTTATVSVLNPQTGLDAVGLPFQATARLAIHGLADEVGVPNEFAATSLASFVASRLLFVGGGLSAVDDERGNGLQLIDPLTNMLDPLLMDMMEDDISTDPLFYINFAGPAGGDDLVATILGSAEVLLGKDTYDGVFNATFTAVRGIELAIAETRTTGGVFAPTERIHFVDPTGRAGNLSSGLTNATTTHGFELALLDHNVQAAGTLETGSGDDFGLIVRVGRTRVGSSVVPGEFVFLSYTGGPEGADIDGVLVPPGIAVTSVVYVDLDLLDTVLGVETITDLYVIDSVGTGTVNIIEAFSLNVDGADTDGDLVLDTSDNCALVENVNQSASVQAGLSGIGCACLCGDVNSDCVVNILDVDDTRARILPELDQPAFPSCTSTNAGLCGSPTFLLEPRGCNVNGTGGFCNVVDVDDLQRSLVGLVVGATYPLPATGYDPTNCAQASPDPGP